MSATQVSLAATHVFHYSLGCLSHPQAASVTASTRLLSSRESRISAHLSGGARLGQGAGGGHGRDAAPLRRAGGAHARGVRRQHPGRRAGLRTDRAMVRVSVASDHNDRSPFRFRPQVRTKRVVAFVEPQRRRARAPEQAAPDVPRSNRGRREGRYPPAAALRTCRRTLTPARCRATQLLRSRGTRSPSSDGACTTRTSRWPTVATATSSCRSPCSRTPTCLARSS